MKKKVMDIHSPVHKFTNDELDLTEDNVNDDPTPNEPSETDIVMYELQKNVNYLEKNTPIGYQLALIDTVQRLSAVLETTTKPF